MPSMTYDPMKRFNAENDIQTFHLWTNKVPKEQKTTRKGKPTHQSFAISKANGNSNFKSKNSFSENLFRFQFLMSSYVKCTQI
jgi:hypothetical protein